MNKRKKYTGMANFVTAPLGEYRPRKGKDRTNTERGWHKIIRPIGRNYLGKVVYLCRDLFGEEFTASQAGIAKEWFKTAIFTESSKRKMKKLCMCYHNMLKRCLTPDSLTSKYYYWKGVKICAEWLGEEGYHNFVRWAAVSGFEVGLTIDKTESLYSPQTCRWISRKRNCRESSHTILDEEKAVIIKKAFCEWEQRGSWDRKKKNFYKEWGIRYGCHPDTIRCVVRGSRWGDVLFQ